MFVLNAIIVDDEEFARSSLYFLLQEYCDHVHICGIAKSVSEARALLALHDINLIFLDIAMPIENGFELIPDLKDLNVQVIFTTAYDEYALKAIKANAADYLLKPIDIDELKEAVDKAFRYISLDKNSAADHTKTEKISISFTEKAEIKKLTLPSAHGSILIDIDEITHITADSNYSIFHLSKGERITVSRVLKDYEEILPSHQFIRIHKSSIINLNYLKEYNSKNGLEVVLFNGDKIAVSRRRSSDFMEKVKIYTQVKSDK